MLEIVNLRKVYGTTEVLRIPELRFAPGEIVGLVGNNGAGKTTLISLVLDLIEATEGQVLSKGMDVSRSENWKMYTSAYLDDSFLIGFLTPDEYFEFLGGLYNIGPADVREFVAQFESVFNGEVLGQKKYIRDLSMGNRKKVGLVGTLIGDPEVVLWDEPFANLDPTTQIRVRNLISDQSANRTFVVSSHDLHLVADVCTRIVILEKGQLVKNLQRSEFSELYAHFGVE